MSCEICGTSDLLIEVNMSPVCSVCTMKFFGGGTPTKDDIAKARTILELKDGEMLQQDVGAEAAKILGRGKRR